MMMVMPCYLSSILTKMAGTNDIRIIFLIKTIEIPMSLFTTQRFVDDRPSLYQEIAWSLCFTLVSMPLLLKYLRQGRSCVRGFCNSIYRDAASTATRGGFPYTPHWPFVLSTWVFCRYISINTHRTLEYFSVCFIFIRYCKI